MRNDYVEHFYSTSLNAKLARLTKMAEDVETVDLRALANEISDGCRGCEQLVYGDVTGLDQGTLVSVLDSLDRTTMYVRIETDSHSNVERVMVLATKLPSVDGVSEDAWSTYQAILSPVIARQWKDLAESGREILANRGHVWTD